MSQHLDKSAAARLALANSSTLGEPKLTPGVLLWLAVHRATARKARLAGLWRSRAWCRNNRVRGIDCPACRVWVSGRLSGRLLPLLHFGRQRPVRDDFTVGLAFAVGGELRCELPTEVGFLAFCTKRCTTASTGRYCFGSTCALLCHFCLLGRLARAVVCAHCG